MPDKTVIDVYTDASGNIKSKDFGYSAVFWYDNVEYNYSYTIDQKQLKDVLECEVEFSNPTIEVLALVELLSQFVTGLKENEIMSQMPLKLKIHSDYMGVSKWFNKDWGINKDYIRKLIRLSRKYTNGLKDGWGIEVEVVWVKGHSGIEGNERADVLAGERLNQSNIKDFFKIIKIELC